MKKRVTAIVLIASMFLSTVTFADERLVEICSSKPSEASSKLSGAYEADKANDGINDNAEYSAWVSDEKDTHPYWQADLCMGYKISRIEVEGRIGAAAEERKNFRVLLSNDPTFSEYEVAGEVREDYGDKKVWTAEPNFKERYQYVRVEKTADGALSIGEIRVYAKESTLLYGDEVNGRNSQQPLSDEATRYELPSDIIGTDIEKEVRFLSALNIMRGYPDGTFSRDEYITRAEFAAIAVKLTGFTTHGTENTFSDVTSEHWAYDAIEICAEMGLINGVEEDIFAPDDIITMEQAVKIIVSVLGYKEMAQQSGGYPSGYMNIAQNLNLLSNVSADAEGITRGGIAILVYNSLFAKMPYMEFPNSPDSMYDKSEDTILERVFGLKQAKGLVTEVTGLSLTNESIKRENYDYIVVDGVRYLTEDTNYKSYFGNIVYIYYREDYLSDDPTAVIIIPSSKGKTFTVDAEDALEFNNKNELVYEDKNGRRKRIEFAANLDVIYNNRAFLNYNRSTLLPSYGTITALDYDGNGKYDIMFIRAVKTYVVNWVNAEENTIYPKPVGTTKLDAVEFDNNDYIVNLYNIEGEKIEFSALKEWDVLSVEESANSDGKRLVDIYVSDAFARGQVTAISDDGIRIRNKEYGVAESLDMNSLQAGDSGTFYLDYYGRAAAFDANVSSDGKYGFLMRVYDLDDKENTMIRIFTSSGAFKEFQASSKLKVDGDAVKGADNIKQLLMRSNTAYGENGVDIKQLVRYTITAKNEIKSINTIYKGEYEAEDENLSKDFEDGINRYRRAGENVFGMVVRPADGAVMMRIPEDMSREDDYAILSMSNFAGDADHKFAAYDCGKMNTAKAIIQFAGTQAAVPEGASFFVVDKVSKGLNRDDDVVNVLCGFTGGAYVEYPERDANIITSLNLKRGDIVALSLTESKEIKDIEKRFYVGDLPEDSPVNSISTNKPMGPQENWRTPYTNLFLAYGEVVCKNGNYIKVDIDITNCGNIQAAAAYKSMISDLSKTSTKKYIYDSTAGENGIVRLATNADFIDAESAGTGSKVVMKINNGLLSDIVILK